MRHILPSLLLMLAPTIALAFPPDDPRPSGNIAFDFAIPVLPNGSNGELEPTVDGSGQRSPKSVWLAGGLSLIVPGSGQIYAETPWWRPALYATIEAIGWVGYLSYTAKGDNATSDFQNFADQHWDVTKYIDWISTNYQSWPDESVNKDSATAALTGIYRSHDPTIAPWERVDFAQLRKLERSIKDGFSHTLPDHGDQQYYEEIGKYVQYRAGWDDHAADVDTAIYAPSYVTERNLSYVRMRLDANNLYSIGQTALIAVILNHIVSMFDAALTAGHYNAALKTDVHGELLPNGRIVTRSSLGVSVRF